MILNLRAALAALFISSPIALMCGSTYQKFLEKG
jgi:hypothetical protein